MNTHKVILDRDTAAEYVPSQGRSTSPIHAANAIRNSTYRQMSKIATVRFTCASLVTVYEHIPGIRVALR